LLREKAAPSVEWAKMMLTIVIFTFGALTGIAITIAIGFVASDVSAPR
jgi:hypothetical protein